MNIEYRPMIHPHYAVNGRGITAVQSYSRMKHPHMLGQDIDRFNVMQTSELRKALTMATEAEKVEINKMLEERSQGTFTNRPIPFYRYLSMDVQELKKIKGYYDALPFPQIDDYDYLRFYQSRRDAIHDIVIAKQDKRIEFRIPEDVPMSVYEKGSGLHKVETSGIDMGTPSDIIALDPAEAKKIPVLPIVAGLVAAYLATR